jgi:hypothetical protein
MCTDVGQLVKMFTFLISNEVCSNEDVALRSSQEQLRSKCKRDTTLMLLRNLRSSSKTSISVFYIFYVKNGKICGKTMKRME